MTGVNPRTPRYLACIEDEPSVMQRALIENMISLEWASLQAEAEGGLVGIREARESTRLFQKLLVDFEATLPRAGKADRQLVRIRDRFGAAS
jgi:hypothetical protein